MISLADLQRRISSGDLSADAAVTQSLDAITAQDKTIGAFVCRRRELNASGVAFGSRLRLYSRSSSLPLGGFTGAF